MSCGASSTVELPLRMRFLLLISLIITPIGPQRTSLSEIDGERIYSEINKESGTRRCDDHTRHVFSGVGSISIVCLLVVILLHSVFAQLRNLHGKIVISCAVSTLLAMIFLLSVYNYNFQLLKKEQMNKTETSCNNTSCTFMTETVPVNVDNDSRTQGIRHIDENWKNNSQSRLKSTSVCTIVGLLGLFSNISMFSWMTVMCFNMLRTFRRMEPRILLQAPHLRFLAYSLFGWGFPTIVTLFALAANTVALKKSPFNPRIGETICFIDDKDPRRQLIFFYLPMCFLLLLNMVGFIFCVISLRANSGDGISPPRKNNFAFSKLTPSRDTRIQMVTLSINTDDMRLMLLLTDTQHKTICSFWILVVF